MSQSRKPLTLLAGAAVAAGSLFSMDAMAGGYMQDTAAAGASKPVKGYIVNTHANPAQEKAKTEGKCGEGKCGGDMRADAKHAHEGGCGMAKMDTDKDGRLSRAEFDAAHKGSEEKFAGHDLDGDGFITQAEMDKHHAEMKSTSGDKSQTEGKCGEGKCGEGKCGGNK